MKAEIYKLLAKYQEELDTTHEVLKNSDLGDDDKLILESAAQTQERMMIDLLHLVTP